MSDHDDITSALLAGTLGIAEHGLAVAGVEPEPDAPPPRSREERRGFQLLTWPVIRVDADEWHGVDRTVSPERYTCSVCGASLTTAARRRVGRCYVCSPPGPLEASVTAVHYRIHDARSRLAWSDQFPVRAWHAAMMQGPGSWGRRLRHAGYIDDEGAWRPRRLRDDD
jgi:hypothetical protein